MAYPFIGDSKPLLIIDPGHGGNDGGGGTNKHWKEKDLILKISLYQYDRFKQLGIPIALTRNKDVYLSPEVRTSIVKSSGAKYCLSNHINAGGGDGAEFIHSKFADGKLEQLMADEIKKVGQNVRRIFTRKLASGADYYFMHRDTGSVITTIAEYGFADSKRDDVDQLKNNWKEYAEAIVKAYCRYFGVKYVAPGNKQSGKPKPSDNKRWRLQTGLFDDADSYARAIDRLADDYGWLLHEKANTTEFNPRYRIVTGLFTGKNVAEYYADQLREKYGWLVSVIEG